MPVRCCSFTGIDPLPVVDYRCCWITLLFWWPTGVLTVTKLMIIGEPLFLVHWWYDYIVGGDNWLDSTTFTAITLLFHLLPKPGTLPVPTRLRLRYFAHFIYVTGDATLPVCDAGIVDTIFLQCVMELPVELPPPIVAFRRYLPGYIPCCAVWPPLPLFISTFCMPWSGTMVGAWWQQLFLLECWCCSGKADHRPVYTGGVPWVTVIVVISAIRGGGDYYLPFCSWLDAVFTTPLLLKHWWCLCVVECRWPCGVLIVVGSPCCCWAPLPLLLTICRYILFYHSALIVWWYLFWANICCYLSICCSWCVRVVRRVGRVGRFCCSTLFVPIDYYPFVIPHCGVPPICGTFVLFVILELHSFGVFASEHC